MSKSKMANNILAIVCFALGLIATIVGGIAEGREWLIIGLLWLILAKLTD